LSEQEKSKRALITVIKDLVEPVKRFCENVSNDFESCISTLYVHASARNHFTNTVARELIAKLYEYVSNLCDKYPDGSPEWGVCMYIADKITALKYIISKLSHINYHIKSLEVFANRYAEREIRRIKGAEATNT